MKEDEGCSGPSTNMLPATGIGRVYNGGGAKVPGENQETMQTPLCNFYPDILGIY